MRSFGFCVLVVVAVGCGKKPEPAAPSADAPGPGPVVAAELAPFQGTWAVVKLEVPVGSNSPEIGPVSDAVRQKIVVTVTDKLVKLDRPSPDGETWTRYLVLEPSAAKSAREFDLIASDETAAIGPRSMPTKGRMMDVPRDRYAAIYKFEGDVLVVALPLESRAERPAEFKPALAAVGSGYAKIPVVVVHLKKK